MPRYAALLRGVSPMNCRMPDLKAALEQAGFGDVRTVISSGNAVFTSRAMSVTTLEARCEAAMTRHMGRAFMTIVRSIDELEALLASDPFARMTLPPNAKRNVTFMRKAPTPRPRLPVELRGAQLAALRGREAFSYYVPREADPAFMVLIEKTFGKDVTTRTWEVGGALALLAGRWIAPLLFDQSPRDPVVFGTVTSALLVVAILASAIPAFRGARADPNLALRAE